MEHSTLLVRPSPHPGSRSSSLRALGRKSPPATGGSKPLRRATPPVRLAEPASRRPASMADVLHQRDNDRTRRVHVAEALLELRPRKRVSVEPSLAPHAGRRRIRIEVAI